jgi:cytochrome b561
MLAFLNAGQLVLYIALLALLGQGVLYVLAGERRDGNFFYGLLKVMTKPFTWVARKLTPRKVADQHVPFVAFFLLLVVYAIVTIEKISYCVNAQMVGCK